MQPRDVRNPLAGPAAPPGAAQGATGGPPATGTPAMAAIVAPSARALLAGIPSEPRGAAATSDVRVRLPSEDGEDEDATAKQELSDALKAKRASKELTQIALTILHLVVISVVVLNGYSSSKLFHTRDAVYQALVGSSPAWTDSARVADVYTFLHDSLAPTVFGDGSFDNDGVLHEGEERGTLLGSLYFLGPVRLGIVRTKATSCGRPAAFAPDFNLKCYPDFTRSMEDQSAFVKVNGTLRVSMPFNDMYRSIEPDDWSDLGLVYPPPALFIFWNPLTNNLTAAQATIDKWRQLSLIDRSVKLLQVDTVVYNPVNQYVVIVRMRAEFPASGGVHATVTSRVTQPSILEFQRDYVQTIFLIGLWILTIYFFLRESYSIFRGCKNVGIRDKKSSRWSYFKDLAGVASFLSYVLILISGGFIIAAESKLPPASSLRLQSPATPFISFFMADRYHNIGLQTLSVGVYFVWLRLLSYLAIVPQFAVLTRTIAKAWESIYSFLIMMFLVFFASSMAHLLVFGTQIIGFQDMTSSMTSLMLSLLGVFDFDSLKQAAPVIAPILFVTFVFLAVIVMLNMLVGIISAAFDDTQDELKHSGAGSLASELMTLIAGFPIIGRCFKVAQESNPAASKRLRRVLQIARIASGTRTRDPSRQSSMNTRRRVTEMKPMDNGGDSPQ